MNMDKVLCHSSKEQGTSLVPEWSWLHSFATAMRTADSLTYRRSFPDGFTVPDEEILDSEIAYQPMVWSTPLFINHLYLSKSFVSGFFYKHTGFFHLKVRGSTRPLTFMFLFFEKIFYCSNAGDILSREIGSTPCCLMIFHCCPCIKGY